MSKPPATPAPEPEKDSTASILTDLKTGGMEQSVMPDLGGVNPSTPTSKFKVHSQTLVIALVLLASGAALYTMRKQGMGAGIRFDPPKIDYDVNKAAKPADEVHQQQVMLDLEKSQNPNQVPADKIQKNPFQLETHGTAETVAAADPVAISAAMEKAKREARLSQIRTVLSTIEVNAIMEGNTPLARINGKIVREGEMLADVFKVKEIHDRSVDLEADGQLFTVNMSENTVGGKPRPPAPHK